jgi:hypothetical protein
LPQFAHCRSNLKLVLRFECDEEISIVKKLSRVNAICI